MEGAFASRSAKGHVYVIRSFGRGAMFRSLTCGILEGILPSLDACVLALAADDPDAVVYREALGPWEDRVVWGVRGAERQVAFIDQIAPAGQRVMVLDDNIQEFRNRGQPVTGGLDGLVSSGFGHMDDAGAKVWSGNHSPNPQHWIDSVGVGNGLVSGAAFGMVATHEPSRYSRFGQVMDDTERSCRYYEHDGATVRLLRFQVYKKHRPGLFKRGKGGISASLTADEHAREGAAARAMPCS